MEKSIWSDNEISTLINLWEEHLPELNKPRRDRKVFLAIAKKLQKLLKRNIPFTGQDVQLKLYILRKQYNKNKNRQINLNYKPSWRFFSKIDKFSRKIHLTFSSNELKQSIENDFIKASEENLDENGKMDYFEDPNIIIERGRWSDKEITSLIDLWEEYLPELRKPGKNIHVFIEMAKRLRKSMERDHPFTFKDIQMKLYILKKQYTRNKKRHKDFGVSSPSWRFFSKIQRFLDPSDLLLSSSECTLEIEEQKPDAPEAKLVFENGDLNLYRERVIWTDEEISILINLWKEYLPELRGPRKNKSIFIEMAHRLQEIVKRDIPYTYKDIEVKLVILKKQYNTNKRRLLKPVCNPPTWRFFPKIHSFYDEPHRSEGYFHWLSHTDSDSSQNISLTRLETLNTQHSSSVSGEVPFPVSEEIVSHSMEKSKIITLNEDYRSNIWSREEISALIDVWEEYSPALQGPGKKNQIFIEMAKKLETILKKDIPFTYKDIQIKLNTLKNQYRALRKKYEESGSDSSFGLPSWQFFSRIHKFYGKSSLDIVNTEKEFTPDTGSITSSECTTFEDMNVDLKDEMTVTGEKYKWTEDEISALIDLWEENLSALRSPGRNMQIFIEMAKKLQKILKKEVPFTYRDIQTKLYSLKSQYGTNKRKQMKVDSRPPAWQFFSRIDKFYMRKPENNDFSVYSQTDSDVPAIRLTSSETSGVYGMTPVDHKNLVIEELNMGENQNVLMETNMWTSDETSVLIDLWEKYLPTLRSPEKSTQAFIEIAKKIQKILRRDIPFTHRDIEAKLDSLKSQYCSNKRKMKKNSSDWRFFSRINKFYERIPSNEYSTTNNNPQIYEYYDRLCSPALDPSDENDAITSEVSTDTPEQVIITCTDTGGVLSLEENTDTNKLGTTNQSSPNRIFRNAIEVGKETFHLENLKLKKQMYQKMLELLEKQIQREEQRKIEMEEREEKLRKDREEREEKLRKEREEREEHEEQRRREWEAKCLDLITQQKEQMDKLLLLLTQGLETKKE